MARKLKKAAMKLSSLPLKMSVSYRNRTYNRVLGGKIQPRPTVTYHILMYLFMSIFPCENLYPRVIIVHIA